MTHNGDVKGVVGTCSDATETHIEITASCAICKNIIHDENNSMKSYVWCPKCRECTPDTHINCTRYTKLGELHVYHCVACDTPCTLNVHGIGECTQPYPAIPLSCCIHECDNNNNNNNNDTLMQHWTKQQYGDWRTYIESLCADAHECILATWFMDNLCVLVVYITVVFFALLGEQLLHMIFGWDSAFIIISSVFWITMLIFVPGILVTLRCDAAKPSMYTHCGQMLYAPEFSTRWYKENSNTMKNVALCLCTFTLLPLLNVIVPSTHSSAATFVLICFFIYGGFTMFKTRRSSMHTRIYLNRRAQMSFATCYIMCVLMHNRIRAYIEEKVSEMNACKCHTKHIEIVRDIAAIEEECVLLKCVQPSFMCGIGGDDEDECKQQHNKTPMECMVDKVSRYILTIS